MIHEQAHIDVDCQYDERNQVTTLISGKSKEIRKGKKLKDQQQYPLQLTLPHLKIKIHMNLSAEHDMFLLYVN